MIKKILLLLYLSYAQSVDSFTVVSTSSLISQIKDVSEKSLMFLRFFLATYPQAALKSPRNMMFYQNIQAGFRIKTFNSIAKQ